MLFRFIAAYNDLKMRSPNLNAEELFTSAADILRSSGAVLRPLSDIQKVRSDECLIICAVLIFQLILLLILQTSKTVLLESIFTRLQDLIVSLSGYYVIFRPISLNHWQLFSVPLFVLVMYRQSVNQRKWYQHRSSLVPDLYRLTCGLFHCTFFGKSSWIDNRSMAASSTGASVWSQPVWVSSTRQRSTTHALVAMTHAWESALDRGGAARALFVDFKKGIWLS